jgi:hypothetical protein
MSIFFWGTLGGLLGYILAYILPFGRALVDGTVQLGQVNAGRWIGFLLVALSLIALGGGAGWLAVETLGETLPTDQARAFALVSGIGAEGMFRSLTTPIK